MLVIIIPGEGVIMISLLEGIKIPFLSYSREAPKSSLQVNHTIAKRLYMAQPSWKGQAMPMAGIAGNCLQVARQIASAIPHIGPTNHMVGHTGPVCSSIGLFLGVNDIHSGYTDYQKALTIQDSEGKGRAVGRLLCGSVSATGSSLVLGGKIVCSAGIAGGTALMVVAERLFGLGSAIAMGIAGVGLVRCHRFYSKLNGPVKENSVSESLRCFDALEYLKNSLGVSVKERGEIVQKIQLEHPDSSVEAKEEMVVRKIFDQTEVKMKHLKRRSSQKALFMILDRVEPILAKLLDPKQKEVGIVEARQLLDDLKKETRKKVLLYVIVLIAAMIGLAGFIAACFLTAGSLPFILSGTSTAIYLGLLIHAYYQHNKKAQPLKA